MVMGDLVLTEDEVENVMMALQKGGVEQTALHNHVLHESPRIMYMHISAHGDAAKIARTIHDALAQSKTPLGPPSPSAAPWRRYRHRRYHEHSARAGKPTDRSIKSPFRERSGLRK